MDNGILSDKYQRLVVMDEDTGKTIAIISRDMVSTAADNIVVKLTPMQKEDKK